MVELSSKELERYDRQIRIEGFDVEGQKKLKKAKVVVAGAGGLGCPTAIYLAAAGVGKITIIDKEKVELSNLNRQILHWDKDIGKYKIDSAVEKLSQLNPDIEVEGLKIEITEQNVRSLIEDADVIVDGMDNFKTRFLLNEACVKLNKPFVHAAVYGLTGELMTIIPGKGPCYRCYLPVEPPEIKPFPILGATPGVLACLEAMETIKLITGIGEPLTGKLLLFDGFKMTFQILNVKKLENCPVCSGK
jgi:adenylyltransferase/sulfurtransferase